MAIESSLPTPVPPSRLGEYTGNHIFWTTDLTTGGLIVVRHSFQCQP